jgi:hypothetical protein
VSRVHGFAYLFPRIGESIGHGGHDFSSVIVPGLVASTAVFTGVATVSLPLSIDLGAAREIEDRMLARQPARLHERRAARGAQLGRPAHAGLGVPRRRLRVPRGPVDGLPAAVRKAGGDVSGNGVDLWLLRESEVYPLANELGGGRSSAPTS